MGGEKNRIVGTKGRGSRLSSLRLSDRPRRKKRGKAGQRCRSSLCTVRDLVYDMSQEQVEGTPVEPEMGVKRARAMLLAFWRASYYGKFPASRSPTVTYARPTPTLNLKAIYSHPIQFANHPHTCVPSHQNPRCWSTKCASSHQSIYIPRQGSQHTDNRTFLTQSPEWPLLNAPPPTPCRKCDEEQ